MVLGRKHCRILRTGCDRVTGRRINCRGDENLRDFFSLEESLWPAIPVTPVIILVLIRSRSLILWPIPAAIPAAAAALAVSAPVRAAAAAAVAVVRPVSLPVPAAAIHAAGSPAAAPATDRRFPEALCGAPPGSTGYIKNQSPSSRPEGLWFSIFLWRGVFRHVPDLAPMDLPMPAAETQTPIQTLQKLGETNYLRS